MATDLTAVLQFLAFLAIGLISVTVPTYAISITYLGHETEVTLKELRRRREVFSKKLEEMRNRLILEEQILSVDVA